MILDTSALIAVIFEEPEGDRCLDAIGDADVRMMSAVSFFEGGIVADSRPGSGKGSAYDRVIDTLDIDVVGVTRDQATLARDAYRRFGKGNHPAKLNFGDCFAYALAKATGEPLLFKGDDFAQTDLDTVSL